MKVLVTGMNGTVAPALRDALLARGHNVIAWDRSVAAVDTREAVHAFVDYVRPDAFCHLATGPLDWAAWAADACALGGAQFLYTSSVSVYGSTQAGPFTPDDAPAPDDDYGRYKLEGEARVRAAHPRAVVARLGWQIGTTREGNHMAAHCHRLQREEGVVRAGTTWRPACTFLPDTAEALCGLLEDAAPGCYHVGGNPGLTFFDVVRRLNRLLGEPWEVVAAGEAPRDNRLVDARVPVRPITARLPG